MLQNIYIAQQDLSCEEQGLYSVINYLELNDIHLAEFVPD
jgi:hypothetical protein